jgi:hypothetical protein
MKQLSNPVMQFVLHSPVDSKLDRNPMMEQTRSAPRGRRHSATSVKSSRGEEIMIVREENAILQCFVSADQLTSEEQKLCTDRQEWYNRVRTVKTDIKRLTGEILARD